jgi:hypothetical protein
VSVVGAATEVSVVSTGTVVVGVSVTVTAGASVSVTVCGSCVTTEPWSPPLYDCCFDVGAALLVAVVELTGLDVAAVGVVVGEANFTTANTNAANTIMATAPMPIRAGALRNQGCRGGSGGAP